MKTTSRVPTLSTPAPPGSVSGDVSTTFRLPAAMLAHADLLARTLRPPPGGKLTRSNVLRAALERGLIELEHDLVNDIDDTIRRRSGNSELPSLEEVGAEIDSRNVAADLAAVLAELDAMRARVAALTTEGVE